MTGQNAPPVYQMLQPAGELHHHLLRWFDQAKRAMPWRETTDPYAIWLSETMLQQTQVETVKPYWSRFLAKFPTVRDLAQADLQEVLALWAGLGYYRRARHLHLAAQHMVEHHNGAVPDSVEALLNLPGIGRYTAGAVASIAFGVAAPVVDGNVMRVLSRLTGYDRDIADPKNAAFFWKVAAEVLAGAESQKKKSANGKRRLAARYGDINQSLMELGSLVCTPARPACLMCPVHTFCRAFAESRQESLPVKKKKAETPIVRGVAVIVRRGPDVLLMQRPARGVWAEMWEFPVAVALKNLTSGIEKFLGLKVRSAKRRGQVRHQLTHRTFEYDVVTCEATCDRMPQLPECLAGGEGTCYTAARWVAWPQIAYKELPLARVAHKIAACAG